MSAAIYPLETGHRKKLDTPVYGGFGRSGYGTSAFSRIVKLFVKKNKQKQPFVPPYIYLMFITSSRTIDISSPDLMNINVK